MEVKPTLRPARESDLPFIQALYNWAIEYTTSVYDHNLRDEAFMREWWHIKHTKTQPVILLEIDGKAAGFATYGDFRPHFGFLYTKEHSLYLHPDYQGRGWGKYLLEGIEQEARNQNVHVLIAGIDADNQTSIRLHQKLGFQQVGQLKEVGFKFNRFLDLVFLQKVLQ